MGDSMSTIINATTTNGVVIQPDNSGSLVLQTNNGTTALTIDTSQRAAFVAGTAAAPAITTTGDTNTGMFFPAADTIAFAEGGTEAMRLDSSGNVGIGTSSPGAKLGLDVSVGTGGLDGYKLYSSATARGALFVAGSAYNYSGVGANNLWLYNPASDLVIGSDGAYVTKFVTNSSERMRIDSSGNLLIGRTSAGSEGAKLSIYGNGTYTIFSERETTASTSHFRFVNPNGVVGRIDTSGTSTSYVTSSDYRLKENISPMTGALDKIAQLKPVTYKWKIDGSDGQGFIAHELQAIVPDAVVGEKDAVETYTGEDGIEQTRPAYQGIDTSFLVATLTAAIQEMKAIIDAQSVTINDLKARVETLEAK